MTRRSWAISAGVLGMLAAAAPPTSALAADAPPPASPSGGGVYVEPIDAVVTGPFGPAISSERRWRTMCGSASDLTVPELQTFAANYDQAVAEGRYSIAVSSPADGAGPTVIFNLSPSVPAAAATALSSIATVIQNTFQDDLTMTINVDWMNLGGSTLGVTSSTYSAFGYGATRNMLQIDMDPDDVIQDYFPGTGTIPVRYDGSSATVTSESTIFVTWGNVKALGGQTGSTVASMAFNSGFSWDYDASNGVNPSQISFQAVAAHECGHAMGFTSAIPSMSMDMLDMYRFSNLDGCCDYDPDTLAEFTTAPRLVDENNPNDQQIFDNIEAEHRMEDGNPWQASHFREQSPRIGIMDPAMGNGETFYPSFYLISDRRALDAIGWDYPDPVPTAACCFSDASCTMLTQALCMSSGGNFQGDGSDCGTTECPVLPGACCLANGSCIIAQEADCLAQGGTYDGALSCGVVNCVAPLGACCFDDGACQQQSINDCASLGGHFVALGLPCSAGTCPQPGACCLLGQCTPSLPAACTAAGGTFAGEGVACVPDPCGPLFGACCFANCTCFEFSDTDCAIVSGVFQGDGTACATIVCPGCGPPCVGDLDGDNTVAFSDLLVLLGAWGPCPGCPEDLDGDDVVAFSDLLVLLGAWGPCP